MRKAPELNSLTQSQLLQLKLSQLSDLPIPVWIQKCMLQLQSELKAKGLKLRPHFWFSNEWFCPDGVTGMALPYYLLHPKLIELEKKYTGHVEGTNANEFMKLARHELGHVLDNGFYLRRLKSRARLFGPVSTPYPTSYSADPNSKDFVRHLKDNYAQAHPEEDWAETVAVWLDPQSNWEFKYRNWPALTKLQYVDDLMQRLKGKRPFRTNRTTAENIKFDQRTLGEYLRDKQRERKLNRKEFFVPLLPRPLTQTHGQALAPLIQVNHKQILQNVAIRTKQHHYKIMPMIKLLKSESKRHRIRAAAPEQKVIKMITNLLIKQQARFLKQGRHRILM